jgi:hypothetical protein
MFEHRCRHGSVFRCESTNLTKPIMVTNWPRCNEGVIDEERFASDVAQMIGFHAMNILPNLNGFSGYDCLSWDIK